MTLGSTQPLTEMRNAKVNISLYMFFWVFPRRQIVVGQLQFDAGEIPKRTYTIFKSRRKFEI